jgi:hypothetical protein
MEVNRQEILNNKAGCLTLKGVVVTTDLALAVVKIK